MKTMTTVKWAAILMLAAGLTANAQGPGGGGPQGGGQQQGGPGGGGNFQPPSADEIVKHMLADFDADKDGKLDATELKKSVEAHQKERQQRGGPQGGQGGGQQGMRGGPQGGTGGMQRGSQGGGQQGGPQGGGQNGGPNGDRPQPPAPDKIAADWLKEFDADKNGSLDAAELAKALEAHRPPQGGGPGDHRGPPPGE